MFRSVADLAEERRLCSPTAHASGPAGPARRTPPEPADPAPQHELGTIHTVAQAHQGQTWTDTGDRERCRRENGVAERLDRHLNPYELERERERELELERAKRSSNRVKEFEELIARTRGKALDGRPPHGAAGAISSPPSKHTQQLPASLNQVPKNLQSNPERKYGDIKMTPPSTTIAKTSEGSEAGNRDCREDAADEELALAVYFDQEMKLLCSLPAAARGLRRHLVADIAKVLRVPQGRLTLVELYEGPVADLVVERSTDSASNTSPTEGSDLPEEPDACSCFQLANKFVDIAQGDKRDKRAAGVYESKYFGNISTVKIRGKASSARPLSAILRPLMETIEEGLSSIDSELVKDRRNIQDTAEADEVADVQNYADATNAIEHHGAMDLSSDTDADSLAYTASVFTIQTRIDDEQFPSNLNTDRSNGVFDRAESCATISSDGEMPQNESHVAQTAPTWTPFAANFSLEIVEAKGLPQAENAGIFPDSYACASLLYADLWSMEQLPVDHATGDEQHDTAGHMGSVSDVQSLPFKIQPHVRTDTHARSVNPKWQSKFTLTHTRPSFIVLDGPDYTKKLFTSHCDVPLQGQNVLLFITIHEQQRFGVHRRMGCVILELKPGPPLDDWFTLHKRNGASVASSTGPGSAVVRLRISYPGSVPDSISPFRLRSRGMDDQSLDGPIRDWSFVRLDSNASTMLTPYRMPETPLPDATLNGHDISYISPPQGANDSSSDLFQKKETRHDESKKESPHDASYLERVARQMFNASHMKKKKSPSHVSQPETPSNTVPETPTNMATRVPRQTDLSARKKGGSGLEVAILSCHNLPSRLADGQSPSPYACVSLILSTASEKGPPQLSHDVRRSSSKTVQGTEKHIRLVPQCQTQTLPECADPEWNAPMFLTEAMRVGGGKILGSQSLDPSGTLTGYEDSDGAFSVLVSVYDQFEFGSDRLLGSCMFPILPGQRLSQTLTLRGCNRLEGDSATQKATIRVRAHLNAPHLSTYGRAGANKTMALLSPWANHRKTSVPCSQSPTAPSLLDPNHLPLMTSRSYLDVSDSDSGDEGGYIRTASDAGDMPTPPVPPVSPPRFTSEPSSTKSNLSAKQVECFWETAGTVWSKVAGTGKGSVQSASVQSVPGQACGNLSHRSSLHAQQTPALLSPSATPSPSSAERHKDPSYTELEQAFMARVAARQLGKDREGGKMLPEGGKMLPGDTLRHHRSYNNHWKPTAHN